MFRVGSRSVAGKELKPKHIQEKIVLALIFRSFRCLLGSVFIAQPSTVNRNGVAQREHSINAG